MTSGTKHALRKLEEKWRAQQRAEGDHPRFDAALHEIWEMRQGRSVDFEALASKAPISDQQRIRELGAAERDGIAKTLELKHGGGWDPGPWETLNASATAGWGDCVRQADEIGDRIVAKLSGRSRAQRMANGALIAAAPSMFSALVSAQRHCRACGSCDVCEAIALARTRATVED